MNGIDCLMVFFLALSLPSYDIREMLALFYDLGEPPTFSCSLEWFVIYWSYLFFEHLVEFDCKIIHAWCLFGRSLVIISTSSVDIGLFRFLTFS